MRLLWVKEPQFSGRGWEKGIGVAGLLWAPRGYGPYSALAPYFLLSSLARQVAASTALMVAARSPPCSRT